MDNSELTYRIRACFGHQPTHDQEQAIGLFADFMTDRQPMTAMILRGSAGTGKTSLAAAIVKALAQSGQKMVLLAPTGRAAKVFTLHAGMPAYTVHRKIYRQRSAADMSVFNLNDNLHTDTLFVVDEASMVSTLSPGDAYTFGSGSLLDDLVHYVYGGRNCRLLLVGDKAQLPPVGEDEAPALMGGVLRAYGLTVRETDLSEVLRQSRTSGILSNATMVREMMAPDGRLPTMADGQPAAPDAVLQLPKLRLQGFADIVAVPGDELIESLATSYSRVGVDETIVVTRSNKRANIYNQGIRRTVLDREDELSRGDQLMIVKNNYYWTEKEKADAAATAAAAPPTAASGLAAGPAAAPTGRESMAFLANGDRCVVQRIRNVHEMYGFRFADATLLFPDYDDYELTVRVVLDTLTSEAAALTREQQEQLYNKVMEDYVDLPLKADRVKALKADGYYNALQVKFGYGVTCHKAQGGQWAHVYIDQGYMTDDMLSADYYHWLYTALTRATEKVFLVNWPKTQIGD